MKNLIFTFFLITAPLFLCAQSTPPKKAAKIILIDSLTKEQNFKLLLTKLIDDGWQIASKDLEYGTIETKPRTLNKDSFETIYYFVVKDSRIVFTGKLNNNIDFYYGGVKSNSSWMDIYYSSNIYIFRPAFEKMIRFAENLNPLRIEYE